MHDSIFTRICCCLTTCNIMCPQICQSILTQAKFHYGSVFLVLLVDFPIISLYYIMPLRKIFIIFMETQQLKNKRSRHIFASNSMIGLVATAFIDTTYSTNKYNGPCFLSFSCFLDALQFFLYCSSTALVNVRNNSSRQVQ